MSYKSIVVHLDTSERTHRRLDVALRMAGQFRAHLTGAFSVDNPGPKSHEHTAGAGQYHAERKRQRIQRRASLERLFHAELQRCGVPGSWIVADVSANLAVPRLGRCADLIIAGQDDVEDPESYIASHFQENLIMSAGCPVLLMPHVDLTPSVGNHVVVAWDGSREAARAVHDALPFMRGAKNTTVLTIQPANNKQVDRGVRAADISAVIARHGIEVRAVEIESDEGVAIGRTLLSYALDLGADLIVMGAYAHARWQELVIGSTTRTMLQSMAVPMLMSH
jgi:nucleotide-binding universal stress UspA family protein